MPTRASTFAIIAAIVMSAGSGFGQSSALTALIPDPVEKIRGTSAAEGVAADAMGNIYGAEVGPRRVMKYVKK